jgi:hypothetical protein
MANRPRASNLRYRSNSMARRSSANSTLTTKCHGWRYGAFQHVRESFAHPHASRRRKSIAAYVTGFIECSWREGRKSVSFRDAQDGK